MAIPNRNSRKIVVGNETYRWIISPKDVESIISQAIKEGWNPKEKGRP